MNSPRVTGPAEKVQLLRFAKSTRLGSYPLIQGMHKSCVLTADRAIFVCLSSNSLMGARSGQKQK